MKKLGIYAHQRSGSSLLYEIMVPYHERILSECFNPSDEFSIVEVDGKLDILRHEKREEEDVQIRGERIALVKRYHHQDYFIKVFGIDLKENKEIFDYAREHYQFVAIERRNTLETVLSGLVSAKHWLFNDYEQIDLQEFYKPFVAKYQYFDYMTTSLRSYYTYKPFLNITKTFVYEDIIGLDRNSILAELGLELSADTQLPLRKLLDFEDKKRLVENYEEVLFWYKTDLEPHLPENRQGGYS